MDKSGYRIRNQAAIHFVTFSVVEWVDVFTRKMYRDIVLDSIRFCQNNKGLLLHCWCIMSNHLHLILSAKNNDLSSLLRDFKKFTSKEIVSAISAASTKAEKTGCFRYFGKRGKQIAAILSINFGDKIIGHKSCITVHLFFKK